MAIILGFSTANAQTTSTTDNTVNPTDIENFDINTAVSNINDLQSSVTAITKELFALDDKERQ
jgi:hypothetical protein